MLPTNETDKLDTIQQVIQERLCELEETIQEFVSSLIQDNIDDGEIEDGNGFADLFINDFKAYTVGETEAECREILLELYKTLCEEGVFTNYESQTMRKRNRIKVGLNVMAQYYEDEEWYESVVDSIEEDGTYWITFVDYEQEEQVELDDIDLFDAPELVGDLLDAPIIMSKMKGVVDVISAKLFKLMFEKVKNANFASKAITMNETLMNKEQKKEKKKKLLRKKKFDPTQYEDFLKQSVQDEWFDPAYLNSSKDIIISDYTMYTLDDSSVLFDEAEIKLLAGGKYGLVGRNGCGKTTLLRRISRYDIPGFPKHVRVMHIEQEISGDDRSVLETVLGMDVVFDKLKKEEETLMKADENDEKASARLAEVITKRMELGLDDETCTERALEVLSGLQFSEAMVHWPTKNLSGGWRMRVSLAGALFVNPDILMLDEPTNHLDFPSVVWLENYLRDYDNTLVIVSHDREFLNNVVTTILEMDDGHLTYYKGNFQKYQSQKAGKRKRHAKQYKDYCAQVNKLQEFIDKFRANPKRAPQVQSRIKTLKAMEEITQPKKEFSLKFDIPGNEGRDLEICRFTNVVFGYYSNKLIFRKINVTLDLKSRIGMIGANGAGKSTFVKLVLRHLEALHGDVNVNRSCRITAFFQHHVDSLDLSQTPIEFFYNLFEEELLKETRPEQAIRSRLGKFNITGEIAERPIGVLSGGQKSRVAFALMCWKTPDFIIMDEPTNHLDMETCDALINGLAKYPGGLLCVSHDQYFLQSICNEFWTLDDKGKIHVFHEFAEAKKAALKQQKFVPHSAAQN